MQQYVNPTQRFTGNFGWFAIQGFATGATVRIDDGAALLITGNWVIPARRKFPFKTLSFSGSVTVMIGEAYDVVPPDIGSIARGTMVFKSIANVIGVNVDTQLWACPATKRIRVMGFTLNYSAAQNVFLRFASNTFLTGLLHNANNVGIPWPVNFWPDGCQGGIGEDLNARDVIGGASLGGVIWGFEE